LSAEETVGYQSWNAANLQYGKFAGEVLRHLGYRPGHLEGRGVERTVDVAVFVTFSGGDPSEEQVTWTLRPELVEALKAMRWVKRAQ